MARILLSSGSRHPCAPTSPLVSGSSSRFHSTPEEASPFFVYFFSYIHSAGISKPAPVPQSLAPRPRLPTPTNTPINTRKLRRSFTPSLHHFFTALVVLTFTRSLLHSFTALVVLSFTRSLLHSFTALIAHYFHPPAHNRSMKGMKLMGNHGTAPAPTVRYSRTTRHCSSVHCPLTTVHRPLFTDHCPLSFRYFRPWSLGP